MKIDMNKDYVITINREVGSGGRTVGRMLAQRLGVPFYDKALINALTEMYHLSVEEIEELKDGKPLYNQRLVKVLAEHYHLTTQELEQIKSHKDWDNFWEDATASTDMAATLAELTKNDGTPTTEDIYKAETEFLTKLASNGPCVMAGRSGYYVLRSHPNHVDIFIQASTEHRIARIMHRQQVSRQEAEDIIERVDRMREDYIRRYTGTTRYDTRNYDLVINMDGMTEEKAVKVICEYIND